MLDTPLNNFLNFCSSKIEINQQEKNDLALIFWTLKIWNVYFLIIPDDRTSNIIFDQLFLTNILVIINVDFVFFF